MYLQFPLLSPYHQLALFYDGNPLKRLLGYHRGVIQQEGGDYGVVTVWFAGVMLAFTWPV